MGGFVGILRYRPILEGGNSGKNKVKGDKNKEKLGKENKSLLTDEFLSVVNQEREGEIICIYI